MKQGLRESKVPGGVFVGMGGCSVQLSSLPDLHPLDVMAPPWVLPLVLPPTHYQKLAVGIGEINPG